jgi:hypothetical protein
MEMDLFIESLVYLVKVELDWKQTSQAWVFLKEGKSVTRLRITPLRVHH